MGRFPPLWSEWNGRYRDTVRDFWRGRRWGWGSSRTRFAGSSDLYGCEPGAAHASVNLVTAHDGFTLRDLVSYDGKHNEANGEDNRDGTDDNRSWNCGVEGPTGPGDPGPARPPVPGHARAPCCCLRHAHAAGGDEIGRTQQGNNNAYCQDNEISWFDWAGADNDLLAFTRRLIALRAARTRCSAAAAS